MLKIKNDVDLKILEKYGFVYNDKSGKYIVRPPIDLDVFYISINIWNRKIEISDKSNMTEDYLIKILYNLIINNLVEKNTISWDIRENRYKN